MSIKSAIEAKEKGNAAFKVSNYPLALANYTTALQLDPGEFTYPLNRCMTHLKMEKWKEAERDATTTLNLAPGNPKALFRRGLARKERKNFEGAREDFEAAMKGGAVEAEEELKLLPVSKVTKSTLPTTSSSPSSIASKTMIPPISSSLPIDSTSSSTIPASRLRAAITPSSNSTTESIGNSDGFMKEVSSRKISSSATGNGKSSFADKKESRDTRLSNFGGTTTRSNSNTAMLEKSTPSIIEIPSILPSFEPIPSSSLPIPTPPVSKLAQVSPPITNSPSYTPYVEPERAPTTALAFEFAWTSNTSSRLSLLKSLDPATLHSLFKTNLSPDLLSEIVQELTTSLLGNTTNDEIREQLWVMNFLRGLSLVPRFSTVVGFLDEDEKKTLKDIFKKSKTELEQLEKKWELV